jgi:ABC-type branched-subunit amino acid transport system ATPase component
MTPMLELDGLESGYGETRILQGVDATVDEGEVVAVVGRNGVGKTTTLRTVLGTIEPWAGTVTYRGEDITDLGDVQTVQRGIGLVPEGRRIFPGLTVVENLELASYGGSDTRNRRDLEWVFDTFENLDERREHRGSDLSGGEQQMLAIARALVSGADLLMLDEPTEGLAPMIVDRVMEVIDAEDITGSFFVPMMSRALLDADGFDDYDIDSFEHYMTGAAPSGKELKEQIIDAFDANLYEVFGQTEMAPVTCLLDPENALEKPDSIGKPITNVTVKVVDADGEEVEPGEVGRIAYRGPTAFREYLGMPEKTDEVFDDEGYFVSSDLVRRDEDGFLYFVGRYDDMIVSGGENIYPAEIEEILHEHESISEAAVVGVPDEEWTERVKAAVVLRDGESMTSEVVMDYVGSRIADFKKPREVEFYEELPRNPTGKILKENLS